MAIRVHVRRYVGLAASGVRVVVGACWAVLAIAACLALLLTLLGQYQVLADIWGEGIFRSVEIIGTSDRATLSYTTTGTQSIAYDNSDGAFLVSEEFRWDTDDTAEMIIGTAYGTYELQPLLWEQSVKQSTSSAFGFVYEQFGTRYYVDCADADASTCEVVFGDNSTPDVNMSTTGNLQSDGNLGSLTGITSGKYLRTYGIATLPTCNSTYRGVLVMDTQNSAPNDQFVLCYCEYLTGWQLVAGTGACN